MGAAAALASARAAPVPPTRVIDGRYVVEGTLGRGGMAEVYRVHDQASGKTLALKQMELGDDPAAFRLRFRREFHTMASLRHPRLVEVFDYGVEGERPYYTLELLDGQDLHDLDQVPARRACELLRDVASALAFLHARRLIHRDLATRNVRCTSDGRAKLIDFGVLATTGIAGDIAGTPPYVAPETLRGQPLDHRADLYGLGAMAYRVLAGRHAFPARGLDQLEAMWRTRPPPPSAIVPEIPPALDELVLSLLEIDPLARPAGAAEVIERLTAIGGLERLPDVEVAHGWIASAALVGRQREMATIKRAVTGAAGGRGRSVVIEAPSGTGKTRLLRELALEAQLAGATVVRTGSEAAGRGPYGVINALASGLFAAAPDEAEAAARPRGAMLARVIPSLRARLGVTPATPAGDPAEDRIRLQADLVAWILDVAMRRPIALVVDDVQRCDESSAAVLAALAHGGERCKLLVAVALRSDEPVRAQAAIAAITDAGQRLRLRGLDEDQLGELCRSLFGAVQHVPRLARWMHKAAGGSPFHSLELARHLVDTSVIRYVEGLWVIPDDPGRDALPQSLADAMDARLRLLPAAAHALGEVLAIHGGALSLEDIVELGAEAPDAVFQALDRLAFEEVLIQAGDRWQFRHDGLREAFLRGLGDARRRELHRRVGEALARHAGREVDRDAEIGWHLLKGGEVARGAELLERAGRALYDAQAFSDCIAPLEAALEVTTRARTRLELLHMLLMAGCMADRHAALRHVDACVEGYRRAGGVHVAARARRVVGRYLGVVLGLVWATIVWCLGLCRGVNPFEGFRTYFIVAGYAQTIHALAFDFEHSRRTIALLEPVAILKNRIPYAVYLLTCNLYDFPWGALARAQRNSERILEILERDRLTPIRDIDRRTGGGGARYLLTLIDVINSRPTLPERLAALDGVGLRYFAIGADQARIINHRMRGEETAAATLDAKVELAFVQLGSVWQVESFMPAISGLAYGFTRDMLGLKRTIERITAMIADGYRQEPFLALARGEYLRERGDAAEAIRELEPLASSDVPMFRIHALPALAEALLARDEAARAKAIAERAIVEARSPETPFVQPLYRSIRVCALAEAALGDTGAATTRLEAALRDVAFHDNPLLTGMLHEARARIALAASDPTTFRAHLEATDRLFRSTENPVLVARVGRLAAMASASSAAPQDRLPTSPTLGAPTEVDGATRDLSPRALRQQRDLERSVLGADAVTTPPPGDPRRSVSAVLSKCRGDAERATRALELLLEASHAGSGYLFLRRKGVLELVAPTFGDEPPTAIRGDLEKLVVARRASEAATVVDRPAARWVPVTLAFEAEQQTIVVGAAALFAGALPVTDPDPRFLAELARELYEAGDVTYTRV